jgi:predicted AlkP superfamily phosphohydrolase/phosphomutase
MGIDGATWDVMEPMIARGELPNFADLVTRGSKGRLISVQPYVSPVVWTTFATGSFPRFHNVLDFFYPYTGTKKRLIKSSIRQRPAIWNIASEAGRRTGVVGYFVTHPPEAINGFMVSDRAFQKNIKGSVHPGDVKEVVDEVRAALLQPEERARLLRRFIPWEYQRSATKDPDDPYHRVSQVVADRIDVQSLIDEFHRQVANRLYDRDLDLFITYYRLVDHASHAAWLYYDSADFESKPSDREAALLQDLIPATYRYMDEIVGELVRHAGQSANIVVISDHGFGSATGSWKVSEEHRGKLTGNHRPDGVWLAAGPDIEPGEVSGMSILDIAPTLLAMQNLPISTELPGRVFEDVLRDDFLESAPIERVESYAVRPVTIDDQQADIESEQDSMRTLRALGYVGGDTELAVEDLPSDSGFWEIDVHLRRRALAGEIVYHLLNDDIENVRRVVRLVSENDPDLVGQLATSTQGEIKRLERSLGQLPFSPATLDRAQNLFTRLASSPLGKLSTDDGSGSRAEIAVD